MLKHKITREEFHDLVWSKPLNKLALELNVKESTLKKISKEYDIPLPKRGHWIKLDFGKEVIVEKLSTDEKWKGALIDIEKIRSDFMEGYQYKLSIRIKEIESLFPKQSIVPRKLTRPCNLVQKAKIYLGKQKSSRWRGFEDVIIASSGLLSISVTKKNVPRMLRFVDAYIKLLEKRGHKIGLDDWDTIVLINGVDNH